MSDKLDEPEFWLPSEFLTDEDILMDHNKVDVSKPSLALCFPTEVPYDYGSSSVLSSPVESVIGSTETESVEDDLLLTELTRQLTLHDTKKLTSTRHNHEKGWVLSGSPQSTLTQVGSWSGRSTMSSNGSPNGQSQVSSPPTTPLGVNNDAWDLIYQAAGQVAKLKMNASGGYGGPTTNPGFLVPPRHVTTAPQLKNSSPSSFYNNRLTTLRSGEQMMKQDTREIWSGKAENGWSYSGFGSTMGQPSCMWPSQKVQQRNQQQYGESGLKEDVYSGHGYGYGFGYGYGYGGGSGGLKRERAGTGVFLPRRYDNSNNKNNANNSKASESRKKPGPSNVWLPNKVSQASAKSFDNIHAIVQPKSWCNGGFICDYDALMAHQRNSTLLAQQGQSLCPEVSSISHEICLPQEWTY